jgi:hypothetical protein
MKRFYSISMLILDITSVYFLIYGRFEEALIAILVSFTCEYRKHRLEDKQ